MQQAVWRLSAPTWFTLPFLRSHTITADTRNKLWRFSHILTHALLPLRQVLGELDIEVVCLPQSAGVGAVSRDTDAAARVMFREIEPQLKRLYPATFEYMDGEGNTKTLPLFGELVEAAFY